MRNEFTAIFELDDESRPEPFYFANCVEMPGVGAEGKTIDETRAKLAEAIPRGHCSLVRNYCCIRSRLSNAI